MNPYSHRPDGAERLGIAGTPGGPPQQLGGFAPMQPPSQVERFDASMLFARGNGRQLEGFSTPSPTQSSFSLSSHSDPASRSQSVGFERGGPLIDFARGYSVPPTLQTSYHGTPYQADGMASNSMQNLLQLLVQEVQKVNTWISGIESANTTVQEQLTGLTAHIQGSEERFNHLEEKISSLAEQAEMSSTKKGGNPTKNISNQHPKLKAILHPLFFELMGINKVGDQALLMNQLVAFGSLPDQEAFTYAEDSKTKLWRPRWLENVNSKVNTEFIKELVNCIMRNEKSKHDRGTGSLGGADFNDQIISIMAKDYFRNIADQYKTHTNPDKLRKLAKKQRDGCLRARRATMANLRRNGETIKKFEESFSVEGVAALIDTDFGSDYISCPDTELSDDSRSRRRNQDVGKGARMSRGLSWWSIDYVAFIRVLDTTANKEGNKSTWDAHPHKMIDRYPDQSIPFRSMVDPGWLSINPSHKVVESPGLKWLEGFYSVALEKGDLSEEDKTFLGDLNQWLMVASASTSGGDDLEHTSAL
ncbi:hypothetical protein JVU11DRAFT_28 [Chiua virens]|nr:hypothetical protein JVU11DRAFT_28 [Chiua virens]